MAKSIFMGVSSPSTLSLELSSVDVCPVHSIFKFFFFFKISTLMSCIWVNKDNFLFNFLKGGLNSEISYIWKVCIIFYFTSNFDVCNWFFCLSMYLCSAHAIVCWRMPSISYGYHDKLDQKWAKFSFLLWIKNCGKIKGFM